MLMAVHSSSLVGITLWLCGSGRVIVTLLFLAFCALGAFNEDLDIISCGVDAEATTVSGLVFIRVG